MKFVATSILSLLIAVSAFGETLTDSVKVSFAAGSWLFDTALGNNREAMGVFVGQVREAAQEDNIEKIVVSGYTSPEGPSDSNLKLATQRCDEIASYIALHAGINSQYIQKKPEGVDWSELRRLAAENPEMPSQRKVIEILDNTPLWIYNATGQIVDGRKKQLMEVAGGNAWNWMLTYIFPELRNAVAVVLYLKHSESPKQESTLTTDLAEQTELSETPDVSDPSEQNDLSDLSESENLTEQTDSIAPIAPIAPKNFYMAVKTNMLFDAMLVPNLSAEFYLGKNISIYGEWMYAWWKNNRRHRYWQTYGGDIGLRWWFGKKAHSKPLTGHHLGIFVGAYIFDFEWGNTGYLGGKPGGTLWDRCLIDSGIEYGYSLPIGKRINIDFSIGFGYLSGHYIKYYPFDNDYYREKEYKMRYFGPTKAEITLVWLIGRGNTNKKKGGYQ